MDKPNPRDFDTPVAYHEAQTVYENSEASPFTPGVDENPGYGGTAPDEHSLTPAGDVVEDLYPPDFQRRVTTELNAARAEFSTGMRSLHEGLAVIEEEFLELRAEIFTKYPIPTTVLKELVQTAAMCQRLAEDMLLTPRG